MRLAKFVIKALADGSTVEGVRGGAAKKDRSNGGGSGECGEASAAQKEVARALEPAAAAAVAVVDAARDNTRDGMAGDPLHNFSYFLDLADRNARDITLSTMLYMVGIDRVHLESLERTKSGALAAEKDMGFAFSAMRDTEAENDGAEVVHIDEFVHWFLPAVNEIFTVQTFMNESTTAFPDVCATLEGYGNPAPAPFPR